MGSKEALIPTAIEDITLVAVEQIDQSPLHRLSSLSSWRSHVQEVLRGSFAVIADRHVLFLPLPPQAGHPRKDTRLEA